MTEPPTPAGQPDDLAPGDADPDHVAPNDLSAEAPGNAAQAEVAADEVPQAEVASDEVPQAEVASDEVPQAEVASDDVVPDDVAPELSVQGPPLPADPSPAAEVQVDPPAESGSIHPNAHQPPAQVPPPASVSSSWPMPPTAPPTPPPPPPAPVPSQPALPAADPRSEPSPPTHDDGTVASVDHGSPLASTAPPADPELPAPPRAAAETPEPAEIAVPPAMGPTEPPTVAPAAVRPDEDELPAEQEAAPAAEPAEASRGVLVPVLAALVVVLLGLTGFLGWKAYDTAGAPSVEGSRTEALASARDAARAVFSYDYRHLAKDFSAGKAVTTGTFAEQYATTTSKLLDFAVKNKATVAADVSDASVVRATDDEVVCLVFLNQTSSSSAVETPRITQSRLEMTMKHRGGSWLVASINAL